MLWHVASLLCLLLVFMTIYSWFLEWTCVFFWYIYFQVHFQGRPLCWRRYYIAIWFDRCDLFTHHSLAFGKASKMNVIMNLERTTWTVHGMASPTIFAVGDGATKRYFRIFRLVLTSMSLYLAVSILPFLPWSLVPAFLCCNFLSAVCGSVETETLKKSKKQTAAYCFYVLRCYTILCVKV